MKKIFCLVVVLVVFTNVNTFSATRKSNSVKNSSSVQNQSEAVRVALNVVNSLMKRNGFDGPSLTSSETQNWVYSNSRFTDDFKTEYSNYVTGLNMNYVCSEDVDDERPDCISYYDLSNEEQQFYDKYGFYPFQKGQDYPDSVELVRYNEKDGYVITKGKGWKDYIMYIKVINEDGQWKVDGAARINIPKHLQTGLGETYR
ncbi:hypothetical protein [Leptotrichia wadei]|uniref:DUF3828 domain-containing protein n=1 Tax=Leptotrichia wadei (strain F0279) TaxID=888055 RepID=U2PXG6_LEPWF|nr:hypothetical protein [Leptotrichia wadei]ERK48796.1 hypothetical protein HMPREF9015_01586 [Leptotrichia wadei F0279]